MVGVAEPFAVGCGPAFCGLGVVAFAGGGFAVGAGGVVEVVGDVGAGEGGVVDDGLHLDGGVGGHWVSLPGWYTYSIAPVAYGRNP